MALKRQSPQGHRISQHLSRSRLGGVSQRWAACHPRAHLVVGAVGQPLGQGLQDGPSCGPQSFFLSSTGETSPTRELPH